MVDNMYEVLVVCEGLESKLMLESNREGCDKIEAGDFGNQILLAKLAFSLFCVYPDQSSKILSRQCQLCPVLPALVITLVCCRAAEAESQTDDETEDGKKELIDTHCSVLVFAELSSSESYPEMRVCICELEIPRKKQYLWCFVTAQRYTTPTMHSFSEEYLRTIVHKLGDAGDHSGPSTDEK